ncbi:MAG: TorF family putative porin [Acidobacteriota bacterium]
MDHFRARKTRCILLAVSAVLTITHAIPAMAVQGSLEGSATLASDYVFRGISQTLEDPALQLGLDFEHRSGLFAGVWGSNVDFPSNALSDNPRNIEVDLYLGFSKQLARDLSGSVVVTRYEYPGSDGRFDYSYTELGLGILFRDQLGLSVSYSGDVMGRGASGLVFEVSGRQPLPRRVNLNFGLGYYDFGESYLENYAYWSLGVSTTLSAVTIDLSYIGTDQAAERIFGDLAGNRVVLTVTGNLTLWKSD